MELNQNNLEGKEMATKKRLTFEEKRAILSQRYPQYRERPHNRLWYSDFREAVRQRNNADYPFVRIHPLQELVLRWKPSDQVMIAEYDIPTDQTDIVPIILIEKPFQLEYMIEHLAKQTEIAVDVESSI